MSTQPPETRRATDMAVLDAETTTITPMEVVTQNKERADALIEVVNQTKSYQKIGGKDYLQVEAWQLIGRFDSASAITAWTRPLVEDGEEIGQEARVEIWKHGQVIGGAEMACGYDEHVCKGRNGVAQKNAAKSMAQTRATSKAFRMIYSFVAVLAGYQPTTAEEMSPGEPQGPAQPRTAQRRPAPPPTADAKAAPASTTSDLRSVGDLLNHALKVYGPGITAQDIYGELGVDGPLDLDDNFGAHWEKLVEKWGEAPA
jgi:hypothetical protein